MGVQYSCYQTMKPVGFVQFIVIRMRQPLESRCMLSLYKLRCTLVHMNFRFMEAMLDLPVTPTSESIHTGSTGLLDPENVALAVRIPFPATIEDLQSELHVFPVSHPPFSFPVEHGWILESLDSSSGDFEVLEN